MKNKYTHKFDFEVGHLVKSPCKGCQHYGIFPRCMRNCLLLDRIHEVLTNVISCTR